MATGGSDSTFSRVLSLVVSNSPELTRGIFHAAASVNRSTWTDPITWRVIGSSPTGPRGRLPLCAAAAAFDEQRVAFLLDVCAADAGVVDAEGLSPLLALNYKTPFNRAARIAFRDAEKEGPRRRIEARLLAGGGLRGLPWLTDAEKADLLARFSAGDADALHNALGSGFMLSVYAKAGKALLNVFRALTPDPGAVDAVMMRVWRSPSSGEDVGLAPADSREDALNALTQKLDEEGLADGEDVTGSLKEVFTEGQLLLTPQQIALVEALRDGAAAWARRREWRVATATYDDEGYIVFSKTGETRDQWLERTEAEEARINALLRNAGVKRPENTSPCIRAGLARGHFGFEFTGAAAQLDTEIPFPCFGEDSDADGCKGNKVSIRRLLRQPAQGAGYGEIGSPAAAKCAGCGAGAYLLICRGSRGGKMDWDAGSGATHCEECPGLGMCIGDSRNAHCHECGGHPFVGSMGRFLCRCATPRRIAAAALLGDRISLAALYFLASDCGNEDEDDPEEGGEEEGFDEEDEDSPEDEGDYADGCGGADDDCPTRGHGGAASSGASPRKRARTDNSGEA